MGEILSVSGACVCLRKITQLSRFVNENRKKKRQNAFLNEKFIQESLCIHQIKKRVLFLMRDERRASDLKELQVHFEAN